MKKLLTFFSIVAIVSWTTVNVAACKKENDDNYAETLTQEDRNAIRDQFISDTDRFINNHITKNIEKLYISKSEARNNQRFLSYTNLLNKVTDETGDLIQIGLSAEELINLKSDIDDLLRISWNLSQEINENISKNKSYQFLLVNIDKILTGFTIENNIMFASKKYQDSLENEEEYLFTIRFSITLNYHFVWNEGIVNQTVSRSNLNIIILPDEIMNSGFINVINKLAQDLYDNDSTGCFDLDEKKLVHDNDLENIFASQAKLATIYFNNKLEVLNDKVQTSLANIVSQNSIFVDFKFSFKSIRALTIRQLYQGWINQTVTTNGFWDMALLNKNININGEEIDNAFESEFANSYGRKNFVSKESDVISKVLHVNINSNEKDEFVEYGELRLENPLINILGVTLHINSIPILYTYNPKESFAQRAARLFANWRAEWGIIESSDRFALFRISNTTAAGTAFRTGDPKVPFSFANGENRKKYFSTSIISGTGLNNFYINNSNGVSNPKASFDDKGMTVNYSKYWNGDWGEDVEQLENSWKLIVVIGQIKFSLNLAKNKDYFSNFWEGSNNINSEKRYLIEF